MRKRRADALGALLSATFLSCLFALLLLADQAFPPALQADGGIGLRGGIRGSLVLVGGPDHSALPVPSVIPSSTPSTETPAAGPSVEAQPGAEVLGTAESSSVPTAERSPRNRETDGTDDRTVRTPDTAEEKGKGRPEKAKHAKGKHEKREHPHGGPPGHGGTPPGHGGTPPGHARGGDASGASASGGSGGSGHGRVGAVGTPPGHGGTPPGHGGTPPGQGKVKDHGGKGRGKGKSKH
jgi:hypothetical protein